MFADPSPKHNDSDNNLLFKICQLLNSSAGNSAESQQDQPPGDEISVAGAELVDPNSLPADGTIGTVRRVIADQKGILLVRSATTLDAANDSVTVSKLTGAANLAVSQVATATAAAQALASRATRRKVSVKNIDGSIVIYVGHDGTVSSTTGYVLAAGASVDLYTAAAIFAISASGTPRLSFVEDYD
jgi:hypothetical protein